MQQNPANMQREWGVRTAGGLSRLGWGRWRGGFEKGYNVGSGERRCGCVAGNVGGGVCEVICGGAGEVGRSGGEADRRARGDPGRGGG